MPRRRPASTTPLLVCYAARQTAPVTLAVVTSRRDFLCGMLVAVADPTPEQAEILHGGGMLGS